MSIVVVGLNHKTAPIDLLERMAIGDEDLPKALHQLGTYDHVLEGVLLSTCNRTEAYAVVSKFHAGSQDVRNFFSDHCHIAPEDFSDHMYTFHDENAVRHLFRVASGIDSMVIGESEILGQVRRAFESAMAEGVSHRILGAAFRQALSVGKKVRTETAIARNPVSVSSAAVELARRAFSGGTLAGKRVAVVGAGKMGGLAATALSAAGAEDVTVVNRTEERAVTLAGKVGAVPRSFDQLEDVVASSDILICSTTASATVVDRALVERAVGRRAGADPLFIVDIAVPRDVDPSVAEIPGVVLRDIYDLRGVVESSIGSRLEEVSKVEEIIAADLARFLEWERTTEVAPTISTLVSRADEIRVSELEKLRPRLDSMSPEDAVAIDALTRKIVAKLLHIPIDRAKRLSSSKQGHLYLSALRELFELDDDELE